LQKEIARVYYSFDAYEGVILRRQDSYSDISLGGRARPQALAGGVNGLSFEYYFFDPIAQDYVWIDDWDPAFFDEQGRIPVAVRIKVRFGGYESPRELTGTFAIPAGG
jgi:hypothetical protein